jgi:polysaccharide export outer membrane protein
MGRALIFIVALCWAFSAARAEDPVYTLQPGDVLVISSFDDASLRRELPVLPDGKIYYPAAGGVMARGLTPLELQQALATSLIDAKILREGAQIDVTVIKIVGNTIYVTGQVKQPGAFTATSNITVLQAISIAGGLTPFASRGRIKILRKEGDKQTVFRFNYNRVAHGDALATNITLHAGDTVIVP